jgi:hypothetical protein
MAHLARGKREKRRLRDCGNKYGLFDNGLGIGIWQKVDDHVECALGIVAALAFARLGETGDGAHARGGRRGEELGVSGHKGKPGAGYGRPCCQRERLFGVADFLSPLAGGLFGPFQYIRQASRTFLFGFTLEAKKSNLGRRLILWEVERRACRCDNEERACN